MSLREYSKLNSDSSSTSSDSNSDLEDRIDIENYRTKTPIILKPPILQATRTHIKMANELKKEYLDMIPEFRGERELLPRFLEICSKLVAKFYVANNPADFQNEYLMSTIRAKIKGEAAINISSCVIRTWRDLQTALINTYADKRDGYTLCIEMTELKQNDKETVFDFYNKVQNSLNLQVAYIQTNSAPTEAEVLINYFQNYALRILLRGLKEPIGQLMRAKNPKNLNEALSMLTNDFQYNDLLNYTKPFSSNKPQKFIQRSNFQNPTPKYMLPSPITPQVTQQNSYPFNRHTNFNPNVQRNNFGTQVKRPINNFPRPTPMSISTQNTSRNIPAKRPRAGSLIQTQNYQQRPNFNSEQLYNIDEPPLDDHGQNFYCHDNDVYDNFAQIDEQTEYENTDESQTDENHFLEEQASVQNQISQLTLN